MSSGSVGEISQSYVKGSDRLLSYLVAFTVSAAVVAAALYYFKPRLVTKKDASGQIVVDIPKLIIYTFVAGVLGLAVSAWMGTRSK